MAKSVAYLVSIFALPIGGLIMYGGTLLLLLNKIQTLYWLSFVTSVVLIGGVGVSLIPPFCRRRAYILTVLFTPSIRAYKATVHAIVVRKTKILIVPLIMCLVQLVLLYAYRVIYRTIHIEKWTEVCYEMLGHVLEMSIRRASVYSVICRAFRIDGAQSKGTKDREMQIAVIVSMCTYFVLRVYSKVTNNKHNMALIVCTVVIKLLIDWLIPMEIISAKTECNYAVMWCNKKWMKKMLVDIVYFELCKFHIMWVVIAVPATVNYFVFGSQNYIHASSISAFHSVLRMYTSYIYVLIDGAMHATFVGQSLHLMPEKVSRMTYTHIVQVYKRPLVCQTAKHEVQESEE